MGGLDHDAGAEGIASAAAQLSTLPVAHGQLDGSCPRAAEGSLTVKCRSLSRGSWAAAGRAAQEAVPGLARTAGTGSPAAVAACGSHPLSTFSKY